MQRTQLDDLRKKFRSQEAMLMQMARYGKHKTPEYEKLKLENDKTGNLIDVIKWM